MNQQTLTYYKRVCKKCGDLYLARAKYSKLCYGCQKPNNFTTNKGHINKKGRPRKTESFINTNNYNK